MKIFLTDQTNKFPEHLEQLKLAPVMSYDPISLKEQESTTELTINFGELDQSVLFNYHIFPNRIMTFLTEWGHEKREIRAGDTITQQVYIPPFMNFSQKMIFGVRIKELINKPNRIGFSYEPLEGHVERGISTFTVELVGDRTIFKIHTFSTPGNTLTKILGPIFSQPYQSYCTNAALRNFKNQINLK